MMYYKYCILNIINTLFYYENTFQCYIFHITKMVKVVVVNVKNATLKCNIKNVQNIQYKEP